MRAQDFANVPSYWGTFAWQTRNRSPWPSTTTNCYSHEKAPWDLQHSQISWKYIISHSWSYCFWLLVIDFLFSFNDKFRSCQSYQINSTDQKTEVASGVGGKKKKGSPNFPHCQYLLFGTSLKKKDLLYYYSFHFGLYRDSPEKWWFMAGFQNPDKIP